MLSTRPKALLTKASIAAVTTLFAAACTGTITPTGGPSEGSGAAVGSGANGGGNTGGSSGGKATGGTTGKGGSGSGGTSAGGGTTGGGATGGTSQVPQPRPLALEGEPVFTRFVRLTNDQWENSVRDILRLDGPTGVSETFLDAVAGTTDFDNNERVLAVDNSNWSDFQTAAERVADRVTETDAALQRVVATNDANTFIRTLGRRAFRRDLTEAEVTEFRAVFDEGAILQEGNQSELTRGARWVISTMLQSPHFLYRIELGDAGAPLSAHEMAAKVSLWIRDTTPTDSMLDAASAFATAEGAASQAQQMLEDPAALAVMRKFHGELYKFALYDSITKTGVDGYSEAMNPEFKESSYRFFDRVFTENLGVREILTSRVAFVGPNMAPIYGVSVSGNGMTQVELPDRAGYFSQAPFLTLWSRNNTPDSIHRGARLNLDTLCADPGLPDMVLPPVPSALPGETNRMIVTELTGECAGVCHGQLINPIGFAFENFDGVGRFRDTDNGLPVDTTGSYPFVEGYLPFSGATELMEHMASGVQAHQCWAKKMASYALSRDLVETDRPLVESLAEISRDSNGSLKEVMVALVKSDVFRTRAGGVQ